MRRPNKGWLLGFAVLMLVVGSPLASFAQAPAAGAVTLDAVAGRYSGTAVTPGGEMAIAVDLKVDKSALTGTIQADTGPINVVSGSVSGDKVTLAIEMGGSTGTITGTMKGDRIEGTWTMGTENGTFTLKKAADAANPADKPAAAEKAPAAPANPGGAATTDALTGQWDGMTGNSDMSVAFSMNLKLDGEKVSGDISSEQGGAQLNAGTWKGGTLSLSFEYPGMGTITMVGSIKEGKLVGTMDVAGQMQMPWVAVKKAI